MNRLRWTRGRTGDEAPGDDARALEWIGLDADGAPIARVVRVRGPLWHGWRLWRAVALDDAGRVVELRQAAPEDGDWLAYVGARVVGRAPVPLKAVRAVEAALAG